MTAPPPSLYHPAVQKIIPAATMRELDRLTTERYALPSLLLMEAAAHAAARAIAARFGHDLARRSALILCGRGNNGGDGAALARVLWLAGARADVILFGRIEETAGDARANFEIARRLASFEAGSAAQPSPLSFTECETVADWEELSGAPKSYDIIVDALFGTGLTRPLAGIHRQVVEHLALRRAARERATASSPLIIALDLPSGLNADSAQPPGAAVHADLTVTFTAPKPANVLPPAADFNGELIVADIGSPPALIEAVASELFLPEPEDARRWLRATRYAPDSYKNTRGHVLVIAGSRNLTGAAALCGEAAMRAGAGLVTIATPASALPILAARAMPEIMTAPLAETEQGAISGASLSELEQLTARATAIAVGPGLTSSDERTRRFVRAVIAERRAPVVVDADGLNALAPWPDDLRGTPELPLILTPHAGEMLRLIGERDKSALADRVRMAREFATSHHLILVFKGTRTLVAAPDGRVFVNPTGNAGLGTAGAGDTLTGIIAACLAQEFATHAAEADPLRATIAALYIAGLAGDLAAHARGMRALVASDIREHLSAAFRLLDAPGEAP